MGSYMVEMKGSRSVLHWAVELGPLWVDAMVVELENDWVELRDPWLGLMKAEMMESMMVDL